jgi:hypothetical protein
VGRLPGDLAGWPGFAAKAGILARAAMASLGDLRCRGEIAGRPDASGSPHSLTLADTQANPIPVPHPTRNGRTMAITLWA